MLSHHLMQDGAWRVSWLVGWRTAGTLLVGLGRHRPRARARSVPRPTVRIRREFLPGLCLAAWRPPLWAWRPPRVAHFRKMGAQAVTIGGYLDDHGLLRRVGNRESIAELMNVPSAMNPAEYATIIRDKFQLRRTIDIARASGPRGTASCCAQASRAGSCRVCTHASAGLQAGRCAAEAGRQRVGGGGVPGAGDGVRNGHAAHGRGPLRAGGGRGASATVPAAQAGPVAGEAAVAGGDRWATTRVASVLVPTGQQEAALDDGSCRNTITVVPWAALT